MRWIKVFSYKPQGFQGANSSMDLTSQSLVLSRMPLHNHGRGLNKTGRKSYKAMEKMELKHTLEKIFHGYGENGIQAHYKREQKFTKTSRKGTISIKAVNSYFIKKSFNSRYDPRRKTTVWPMYHRLPSFHRDWKEQSCQICIKSLFAVALITNYRNGEDRAASHRGDIEQKSSHSWREKSCHLKGSQSGF